MWETWVWSLGWKNPLKGKATHSSILGLQNSMDCIVHGVAKTQTWLSNFHFILFSLSSLNMSFLVCKIFAEKSSDSPMGVALYSQFSSAPVMSNSVTPWTAACQASLSITNSQSLLKLMSTESVMPSKHLILSSPSPPTFNLSHHQGLFTCVSSSHQMAKVLKFQLQHQFFQWIVTSCFSLAIVKIPFFL